MSEKTILYEPFKTRPLSDFHDELRFEFKDLPTQLFDYYLLKAAREMAREGNLIRRRAIIHTEQCVTRYRLESPDGLEINGILQARVKPCSCGPYLVPRSFTPPDESSCCCCGCNREIWYDDQDKVLHINSPYVAALYFITLSVMPEVDACELPEAFLTTYLDTLMLGTRAKIFLITGRPWTNLQLGQGYYNEFLKAIPRAGLEVATHKMRGGVKMQFGRAL